MASTAPNLHSLSSTFTLSNRSSNVSATSFSFQIPRKTPQFSCLSSKKPAFLHPIHLTTAASCTQKGFNALDAVSPMKKPGFGRNLMVAQATEAVAPATEEAAASQPKTSKKNKKVKYPRRVLDVYQILQVPIITEAAIKNIADENSLMFTVDVRADKKMIRDAICNFFGVKVRKINTLIRPDGTKKAYVMLSKEYNASDLAKKIGIFPSSS
ncbi:50S ribosomal protein L23, chloroplastic-like isoform X1 [Chenopodium quinoa]|uniref:50S ribosomal protein L23, chloroplastic-like isoform X1 n=1 Tax=Chenopodium quinoa TaxID=63459 RepID=UPI000B78C348|nr:50S ribosomal protein L23, chloroplastic-like isoform X1 [Chenopodium quinoa]